MKLSEKYKIKSDELNITLYEKYEGRDKNGKRNGTFKWKPVGYYPNIESLFKSLVDKEINETTMKSFEDIIEKIAELKEFKKEVI